jgi:hypothetical protein
MTIDPAIQKVELKFTATPEDEPRVQDFLAGRPARRRRIFFYDTSGLALTGRGLVLRARVTGGEGETTAKLRPVERDVAIAAHADDEKVKVELDVVAETADWSAKRDRDLDDPSAIEAGERKSLFSDGQMRLIERGIGDVEWSAVERLGPIEARVWKVDDLPGFPYELAAEEWSVDDLHFIEVSIKVKPREAEEAQWRFRAFLTGMVRDIDGDRSRKTERVLRRLAGAPTGVEAPAPA